MLDVKLTKITTLVVVHLVATIALIQFELYLSDIYDFPNMVLEAVFQLCIFIGIVIYWQLGFFDFVRLPLMEVLQVGVAYFLMFTFDCLSYDYNARGTYELLKAFNLPLVYLMTLFMYRQSYHSKIKLSFVS